MDNETYLPLEWRVVATGDQGVDLAVNEQDIKDLLESGRYERSQGSPVDARHFRRSLPDGSCLHLVICDSGARLHCDRYDPRRGPASLALHLLTEARQEAADMAVIAWTLVSLLVR